MKNFLHIFTIVMVLLCVGATESFPYIVQEAAATERCDDFRESGEFRISNNSISASKVTFKAARKFSRPPLEKVQAAVCPPVQSDFQFLYIRLRVLRN